MLQKELGVLVEQEDLRWKLHTKRSWYKLGDKNTKFFHAYASKRKEKFYQKNCFSSKLSLWRVDDIEEAFQGYFDDLFTSTRPSLYDLKQSTQAVEIRVTNEMNDQLSKVYTREEIKAALYQMYPFKSTGPDGFGAFFFRNIGKQWAQKYAPQF